MRPTCISLWSSCQRRFARSHCRHMALQDPSPTPRSAEESVFACAQYHKQRLRFPIDHARVYLFQARARACPRPVVAADANFPSFAGVEGA